MTMDKPTPALSQGEQFLQDNKKKDGVITLPSGLQYKVLVEGSGLKRPLVDTPCDCHYLGTLIDGTQFDSSFDRGKPSTFAPNQVIKGWTEALQLMRAGDHWELYVPSELAYGARVGLMASGSGRCASALPSASWRAGGSAAAHSSSSARRT